MKTRSISVLALTATIAVGLSSCGSTSSSGTSGAAAGGGATSVKDVTIGFAQKTANAPYYVAMQKEAEKLAKEKGFKLVFQGANGDPVQQINQVQTMLAQGVNVLLVNAASPDTEKAQMTQAASKVPLLFIDTPIPGVGFTTVQSDNEAIGEQSGKLMAARFGSGKTLNLGILNGGPTDVTVGPARRAGFLKGLKEGGVTVKIIAEAEADYAQDKAVTATEDMLAAQPTIDAFFGYNDAMALGALQVLKNKNNTKVLVSGVDGQKQALAAIKTGGCTGQYVSTGLNSPTEAANKAIEIAIAVATGAKKKTDYPAIDKTTVAGIDCKNITKYYDPNSVF